MIKVFLESDKFSHIAGVTLQATNRLALILLESAADFDTIYYDNLFSMFEKDVADNGMSYCANSICGVP